MKTYLLKSAITIVILGLLSITIFQQFNRDRIEKKFTEQYSALSSHLDLNKSLFAFSIRDFFQSIPDSTILYNCNGDSAEIGDVLGSRDLVLRFSELSCNSCVTHIMEKLVSNLCNQDGSSIIIIGNGDNEFYQNYLSSYFENIKYFFVKSKTFGTKLDSIGLPFFATVNKSNFKISLANALPITEDYEVIDTYIQNWVKWHQ